MYNKKLLKSLSLVVIGGFLIFSSPVFASQNDEISELKAQVKALQEKVSQLEAQKGTQSNPQENNQTQANNSQQTPGWRFGWNPFDEINRMQQEMDRMMRNSFGRSNGAQGVFSSNMSFDTDFNVNETNDGYEIKFDMTGLDKDKIDIQIDEHSITVKGENSKQDSEKGNNSYFSAQSFGSFMRTIPLPIDADTSKVKTEKKGETLIITMPKKKEQGK